MFKQALTAVALAGVITHASAVEEINNEGQILFGLADGAIAEINNGGVSFNPKVDNVRAATATGIFAEVQGMTGTFSDFDNIAITNPQFLWEVGGFQLDPDTITTYEVSADSLFADGTGTLYKDGEEINLDATWSLSLDRPNSSALFAFSSNVIAQVPETGSVALLGLGLIALGLSRRKQAA